MSVCIHGIQIYEYCAECFGPPPEIPDPDAELTRLREQLAEAQRAEKDWIKVANDLTTHLENCERQRDAARAGAVGLLVEVLRSGSAHAGLAGQDEGWLGNSERRVRVLIPQPAPTISPAEAALKLHVAYEAVPTDRGGKHGPKGKAWKAFIEARDAALRAIAEEKP